MEKLCRNCKEDINLRDCQKCLHARIAAMVEKAQIDKAAKEYLWDMDHIREVKNSFKKKKKR